MATLEVEAGGSQCQARLGKSKRPYLKKKKRPKSKRVEGVVEVVDCLPNKCDSQFNSSQNYKKERKEGRTGGKEGGRHPY
jgi:hypothetical protein